MLTTPSRNPVSQRLKRGEREKCRFWPDNVVMIFFKMKQNALWQLNVSGNLTEPCTTSWGFHQISFNVYNLQFNISFSALCLLFTGSNFPPNCHLLQISRSICIVGFSCLMTTNISKVQGFPVAVCCLELSGLTVPSLPVLTANKDAVTRHNQDKDENILKVLFLH